MKIIDLLNKIVNREEVPKKYRYKDKEYEKDYCYMLYEATGDCTELGFKSLLNDEIEILEEEKKIPEKLSTWFSLEKDCENDNIQYANNNFKTMYEKINEICDYLKSKGE